MCGTTAAGASTVDNSPESDEITEGIRVQAAAQYLEDESDPTQGRYVYIYRIIITNEGAERAKLLTRHWIILDADGNRHDVRGPGVVGEFPDLAAGESFQYFSGCPGGFRVARCYDSSQSCSLGHLLQNNYCNKVPLPDGL